MLPPRDGPLSSLKAELNSAKENLGQAKDNVENIPLGDAAQRPRRKYSSLVSATKGLQKIFVELHASLKEALEPKAWTSTPATNKRLSRGFLTMRDSGKAGDMAVLAEVKSTQERVQSAKKSLDVLVASMEIAAALETQLQTLQADLQRIATQGSGRQASSKQSCDLMSADEQSHLNDDIQMPRSSHASVNDIKGSVIPGLLNRQFNPTRVMSINKRNLYRHRSLQRARFDGTCDWFLNTEEFWEQWLSAAAGRTSKTLICWGPPGIGKSVLVSRIIDALARVKRIHAYYYLEQGSLYSAEALVLSLLRQLCDLGDELESDDLFTYLPELESLSSDNESSEAPVKRSEEDGTTVNDPQESSSGASDLACSVTTRKSADASIETAPEFQVRSSLRDLGLKDANPAKTSQFPDTDGAATFQDEILGNDREPNDLKALSQFPSPIRILLDALGEVITSIGRTVHVVIDAWDEENMEHSSVGDFYAVLSALHSFNCKVLLTSRAKPGPQTPYEHIPFQISESHNSTDIESFVRFRFGHILRQPSSSPVKGYREKLQSLPKDIAKWSQGSFTASILYTSLVLNYFPDATRSNVQPSMRGVILPNKFMWDSWDELEQTLSRAKVSDTGEEFSTASPLVRTAVRALQSTEPSIAIPTTMTLVWLAMAKAPLSPEDYRDAMGTIYPAPQSILSEDESVTVNAAKALERLRGLVVVFSGEVRLSSDEVKREVDELWPNFSDSTIELGFCISRKRTAIEIAKYCIQYLLDVEVEDGDLRSESRVIRLLHRNSFLAHAALCFGDYYRTACALDSRSPGEIWALQSKEKIPEIAVSDSGLDINSDTVKVNDAEELGEEKDEAFARVNLRGNSTETTSVGSYSEQQRQQEASKVSLTVAQLASRLIENQTKRTLTVMLVMYLDRDWPKRKKLCWSGLHSWVWSMSPLHIAARLGLANQAAELVDQVPSMLSQQDNKLSTPFHEAAKCGSQELVRVLLHNANAKAVILKDRWGLSPLEYAMTSNHRETFVLLCDKMFREDVADLLDNNVAERVAQYYGACVGGEESPPRDQMGRALFHSIKSRELNAVEFFLGHNADPNYLDDEKIPSIHHAIRSCIGEADRGFGYRFVRLLLAYGADPLGLAEDETGESALHVAVRGGIPLVVKWLLRHGASPRSRDGNGRPVIFALLDGNFVAGRARYEVYQSIIVNLLRQGADIDEPDDQGRHAIHVAARDGPLEALKLLIVMGAKLDAKDDDEKTPMDHAQESQNHDAANFLKEILAGRH